MAYSQELADRLMEAVADLSDIDTRKMFGGFAVMWQGNMLVGVISDDLMVRVGAEQYEEALQTGGAEMVFTGRPMKGFVTVVGETVSSDAELQRWVQSAQNFVGTLPRK